MRVLIKIAFYTTMFLVVFMTYRTHNHSILSAFLGRYARISLAATLASVGLFLFGFSTAHAGMFDWSDVDFESDGGSVNIEINSETSIESSQSLTITHNGEEIVSEDTSGSAHTIISVDGDETSVNVEVETTVDTPEPEQIVLGIQDAVNTAIENAIELKRLFLDGETITKGYTVETSGKDFRVGVVDATVTVPVEVVFKDIPASHVPNEKTETKVSRIYEYDIRHTVDGGTESLGVLEKPVYVSLKYQGETHNKKVIHYWDKPSQQWVPLPSSTNFEEKTVRATSHFPYARLAVFDAENVYEGPASWYVSGYYCNCAASPTYKRGTELKITNITYGSPEIGSSTIVKVNDYGPDPNVHPERPLDLDKVAYAAIAHSVGSGIMTVRIEVVDPEHAEMYEYKVVDGVRTLANYP